MGVGFSRGYVEGLIEWSSKPENAQARSMLVFEYELDISPFQGSQFPESKFVKTTHTKVGGKDGVLTVAPVAGAINTSDASDAQKGHAISEMSTSKIPNLGNNGGKTDRPVQQGSNNTDKPAAFRKPK